ncbi:MAG: hypothetical protein H6754_03600 [Candidatus Omnitrophica bacterium]|nr:hypothetical protein [Candidatus Omnitrophota bacterium]
MISQKNVVQVFVGGFLVLLVLVPTQAYADRGRDRNVSKHHNSNKHRHFNHYRHHTYPRYGETRISLPGAFLSISIGGGKYYYCDGVYYRRHARRYVVVAPPRGAVIQHIPAYYQPVIINGATYYTQDGIYYQSTPQGYVVAQPPQIAPMLASRTVNSVENNDGSFLINIPNLKGSGYTGVTLKRSGDGYVGPQGEFYSEFPKVAQLQSMYVH